MNFKILKSLINQLNKINNNHIIYLRPLSPTVDFAKVWINKPKPTDPMTVCGEPYNFYFIKNLDGIYVGAVYDLMSDLQWYIDVKYRKKGYLVEAMKQTILCHLFQNKNEQIITIDKNQIGSKNFNASERVAIALGFVKTSNVSYVLANYQCEKRDSYEGHNITKERIDALAKQINYLSRFLHVIHSEIEINFGVSDYSEEVKELAAEIKKHSTRIENFWWSYR